MPHARRAGFGLSKAAPAGKILLCFTDGRDRLEKNFLAVGQIQPKVSGAASMNPAQQKEAE
jgi:hypothetical protein